MIENTLSSAIEKITASLHSRKENIITGALLGELIPVVAPDLRVRDVMQIPTGPGALRKFIDLHLKHVLQPNGKQGSDFIYSIIGASASKNQNIDPDLWRTFVRTNSSKTLVLRESTLQLEDVSAIAQLGGQLIIIPSARNDELNQIRIDFVSSLDEKAAELPDMKAPYAEWSVALRKLGREYYREWTEYRLRKIEDLFGKRLDALGVESKTKSELCSLIRRSQLSAKESIGARKNSTDVPKQSREEPKIEIVESDANFRLAVLDVIQKFSISELRELKLPAGALSDAIARQYLK
jgi:uncharacterized protein YaiL (DUF2058 family)